MRKLINLQMKMIAEEKFLWVFMLVLIIFFVIIKVENFSLFESEKLNSLVDNITYSIIAAFIFYVLTVFYPKSKNCLKMYQNIYLNVYRINDIMTSTFDLFGIDFNAIEQFPTQMEEIPKCFVEKKDKDDDNDKYTISPIIERQLNNFLPRLLKMIIIFRSRYTDYLRPEALSNLDMIEDAAQFVSLEIKNEMSYEDVEMLYYQLFIINKTTRALFEDYQQYE